MDSIMLFVGDGPAAWEGGAILPGLTRNEGRKVK
jgi:hypothetical protein